MRVRDFLQIACISIFTTLFVLVLLVFLFFMAPQSIWTAFIDNNFVSIVGISDVSEINLSYIKELWGYQASLYEVLIASLIGMNSIFAIIAFLYVGVKVKSDSEAAVKDYLKSKEFKDAWLERYREFGPDLDEYADRVSKSINDIDRIDNDLADVNRKIAIISKNISMNDRTEEECSNYRIDVEK